MRSPDPPIVVGQPRPAGPTRCRGAARARVAGPQEEVVRYLRKDNDIALTSLCSSLRGFRPTSDGALDPKLLRPKSSAGTAAAELATRSTSRLLTGMFP
jgi:hypothetical protein